jgi:hypothetical protein
MNIEIRFPYLKELLKWREKHFKAFFKSRLFLDLKKSFCCDGANCGTHYLNAIDAYNLSLCNCRGSYFEVEGQKSRVENSKFLSILKVLQPFWKLPNAAKQLVLLSKLNNFAYGYDYTESFAWGTKSLMRGLMFESIRILIYIGI